MSWYTAGEIIVWLLIAAVLGGVLGWLLRGILRPPRERTGPTPVVIEDEVRTRVAEIDTGASGTQAQPITDDSMFAPDTAKDRVAEIARRTAGGLTPPHLAAAGWKSTVASSAKADANNSRSRMSWPRPNRYSTSTISIQSMSPPSPRGRAGTTSDRATFV